MKQIRIENGILLYYGNRAGRVTKGCAVVDPMFQGPELEGFLRKQTSSQEIQWKDGIFDRLTAGSGNIPGIKRCAGLAAERGCGCPKEVH